jgi:transposase
MRTPTARAPLARDPAPYATSLTDAEWALVAPVLPAPAGTGRPRRWPLRRILDAILYVLRTGGAWRHLPREFPPWPTVHRWFLRLARAGAFEHLAHALTMADRERVGREASPTAAVLDAQAARSGGTGVEGARGYDPARRVVGRKRHALTDTDGRVPLATVSPANLHDSHGGVALLRASRRPWPFLAHCYADRACAGARVATATAVAVTIVAAPQGQKGFAVQPRRWVIERTFGWIGRCRRLARDHEANPSSALAFSVLAAAMVLVRRRARVF